MRNFKLLCIAVISFIILSSTITEIQAQYSTNFQYINPVPNSSYVSVRTKILIRPGGVINKASVSNNLIKAIGSKSGTHYGKLILADDSKTLNFTPKEYFKPDEDVKIILKEGITNNDGSGVGKLSFKFHTGEDINSFLTNSNKVKNTVNVNNRNAHKITAEIPDTSLPSDLSKVIINQSDNPSPGYIFACPSPYLMIADNEGTPIFYRKVGGTLYDFDLQPSGELTYFIYPIKCYGLDSSLHYTRTFNTADGYTPDVHELHVFPDGSYYMFGKRLAMVDMSKIVSGGDTSAGLIDNALQKFDPSGNLIFEWDALQHYQITDVDSNVNLKQHTIDFSHCNAVTIDTDGNPIISSRNLDEITKIDYNTGNIIWRWGGENNQFTFINDDIGFSRQHFVRLLSNGNFGLFDNGVYHSKRVSSGCEYKLDEKNKTATLVRRIYNGNVFTETEGSYQELPDGRRVMSWGHSWSPFLTEFDSRDSITFQLSYTHYVDTYRAFRYQWETNLFTTNIDSINFGKVSVGDSLIKNVTVYNPKDSIVVINGFYCSNSSFTSNYKLPVTINPKDSIVIPLKFKPGKEGVMKAAFNIRSFSIYNKASQMIARQVMLSGKTDNISSVAQNDIKPNKFILSQNYPNPFNPSTIIKYEIPFASKVKIEIFNTLGQKISTLLDAYKQAGTYKVTWDAKNYSSGVYFYSVEASDSEGHIYKDIKKMILIK